MFCALCVSQWKFVVVFSERTFLLSAVFGHGLLCLPIAKLCDAVGVDGLACIFCADADVRLLCFLFGIDFVYPRI